MGDMRAKPARLQGIVYVGGGDTYKSSPERPLKKLATLLNWTGTGARIAREAAEIVVRAQRSARERRLPAEALRRFDRLAQANPVRLAFTGWGAAWWPTIAASSSLGDVRDGLGVIWLWEALGAPGALVRLKRCLKCGEWFADETRNRSKKRCSASCTSQWWDRGQRRRSGHSPYRERPPVAARRRGGVLSTTSTASRRRGLPTGPGAGRSARERQPGTTSGAGHSGPRARAWLRGDRR